MPRDLQGYLQGEDAKSVRPGRPLVVVTDDDNERQRFERSIVLAIQRYEPRLQRVEIQVVTSRENRVLTLEINAKLNVKPVEDVEFRSTLEISRNFFSVTSS